MSYTHVSVDDVNRQPSSKSGVSHANLTDALGLQRMRANVWYLDPGDTMSFHRQRDQEEWYLLLDGPGQIRIEEELVEVDDGDALRLSPETRRQLRNETEHEVTWLVVGAPPVAGDGVVVDE